MMPKTRLLIECKGYQERVGLNVIRGAVGLRLDLNAFRQLTDGELQRRRIVRRKRVAPPSFPYYNVAVAGLHGFSMQAQAFAATHHIELLDYSGLPALRNIADQIQRLDVTDFRREDTRVIKHPFREGEGTTTSSDGKTGLPMLVRRTLESMILDEHSMPISGGLAFAERGLTILEELAGAVQSVPFTYMATLGGALHVHMLSRSPLRIAHRESAEVDLRFRVGYERGDRAHWYLQPIGSDDVLQFALPKVLLERWQESGFDRDAAFQIKGDAFQRIDLVGPISADGQPTVIRHVVGVLDQRSVDQARQSALDERRRGLRVDKTKPRR